ncbi:TolC family protein [Lunatibacter salilacus]|uniref:TolC family protein n=1 Tax=Lunatibacter salilacus TaxID=2483804 RepID=UPI00131B7DBE|nr:TolC family protein [Lunatibacter salilacus]
MKPILCTLFIYAAVVTRLVAQDTLLLNFNEAVQLGLKQNITFQALQNEQEQLRLEKINAKLGHLPNLNISNSAFRQIGQQFQQVEGQVIVTNEINNILSSRVSAQMPIYNGGRRINRTQASVYFEEAGKHGLVAASQEVIFTISQQYLQALLDGELYQISLENLKNQQMLLRQIDGFVETGLRTQADLYNQQAEVARLESVAVQAKIQWESSLWILAETLQLEEETFPVLSPVPLNDTTENYLRLPFHDLYQEALLQRRDLKQQQVLEQANRKMLAVSKSARFPQLNLFMEYSSFYTSLDERMLREQFMRVYPQRNIGFSFNIPLFNNFDQVANIGRSRVNLQNQQLELGALERRIFQEVKLAYENYSGAIKREEATDVQLQAATLAQEAISERFRLGVSNFVDLAQANQQLVTAQSDNAQAKYSLFFQQIMLAYVLGDIQIE